VVAEAEKEAGNMRPTDTPADAVTPPVPEVTPEQDEPNKAQAKLEAADGQQIEGEVELVKTDKGVQVVVEVQDATPGKHGVHIHEKDDCSDIEGKSMGGHFAPKKHPHKLPSEGPERHLGDLGNIEVNPEGEGRLSITVEGATLKPDDTMSFLGRAVVVHMGKDSGAAKQPSGSSGTPIACGAIERS
jgi:Cu-Zn family superoxide dismutase